MYIDFNWDNCLVAIVHQWIFQTDTDWLIYTSQDIARPNDLGATVPADASAHNGAEPSTGKMPITNLDVSFVEFHGSLMIQI